MQRYFLQLQKGNAPKAIPKLVLLASEFAQEADRQEADITDAVPPCAFWEPEFGSITDLAVHSSVLEQISFPTSC